MAPAQRTVGILPENILIIAIVSRPAANPDPLTLLHKVLDNAGQLCELGAHAREIRGFEPAIGGGEGRARAALGHGGSGGGLRKLDAVRCPARDRKSTR